MSQIKSIIVTKLKTNKMEQTAVEYLYKIIHARIHIDKDLSEYLEQAKAMEKQQIERAFIASKMTIKDAEQYYEETFKKQTNDSIY